MYTRWNAQVYTRNPLAFRVAVAPIPVAATSASRAVVPDLVYLESKSLYLMQKMSVASTRRASRVAATSAAPPLTATTADIERAVDEVKSTVRKAAREVIKDMHSARKSETDRRIPKDVRGRQIASVRKLVREARAAGKRMSILRACRKVWQDIKGGYPSVIALYDYCHAHQAEL